MRILLAVDGTTASRRAAEFVERFFTRPDVSVTAVNAVRPPTSDDLGPVPYGGVFAWSSLRTTEQEFAASDDLRERRRLDAERVAEAQTPDDASVEVAFGETVEAISRAAEEENTDLIVVGSNDKRFLERLLGGSVSEDLARKSPRPVLIVRP